MMRCFIFIIISILTLCHVHSTTYAESITTGEQNTGYLPILEDGKEWIMKLRYMDTIYKPTNYYRVIINGDSIIDNKQYKKCFVSNIKNPEKQSSYLLYEKNGRMGWRVEQKQLDIEMIDMTLSKGDSIPFIVYEPYEPLQSEYRLTDFSVTVNKADTIRVRGTNRKRIDIGGFTWIEGIGSRGMYWRWIFSNTTDGRSLEMEECRLNGELLFTKEDFDMESISKTESIDTSNIGVNISITGNCIRSCSEKDIVMITSIDGRYINSLYYGGTITLPSGIYIIRCGISAQKIAIR